jgi:CheY-like chemotaxis protein
MPELSGMETFSILKSIEQTKDIPVVLLTASFKEGENFSAQSLHYIMKPIQREDVFKFVKQYLKKE